MAYEYEYSGWSCKRHGALEGPHCDICDPETEEEVEEVEQPRDVQREQITGSTTNELTARLTDIEARPVILFEMPCHTIDQWSEIRAIRAELAVRKVQGLWTAA